MGLIECLRIGLSYTQARLVRRSPEVSLEDFLVNRFGDRLYRTFFKDYTEKVWGVPCTEISAEWGAQRIKGLSVTKAIAHATEGHFDRKSPDTAQKSTETSLIERFLIRSSAPDRCGRRWHARSSGSAANIHLRHRVVDIERDGTRSRRSGSR